MSEQASLPYAGTSGWSGSDTSKERAEREDGNGVTSRRQRQICEYVRASGTPGSTVKDVGHAFPGLHHGQVSSALSVLHMTGRLVRLRERRDRCEVYVIPDNVNGREVSPHRTNKATSALEQVREQAEAWVEAGCVKAHIGSYSCRHCAGQAILHIIDRRTSG